MGGANKRFKKVPWNKMQGRNLEQGKSEETWNTKVEQEAEKREKRAKKLKEIGYEFKAPALKSATGVAKPKAPEELTNGESEVKAIEAAPVVEEAHKPAKKGKNTQAGVSKEENQAVTIPPTKEDVAESINDLIAEVADKPKKEKKVKKTKIVETAETSEAAVPEPEADIPEKKLKTKKSKTSLVETTVTPVAAPEETAKKSKKVKK